MKSIVEAVFENSVLFPDKNAIIYDDTAISYKDFTKKIKTFACTLKSKKISKGSRIMIEADDLISYFCAFLGCQLHGCVVIPFEKNISIYKFLKRCSVYDTIISKFLRLKLHARQTL